MGEISQGQRPSWEVVAKEHAAEQLNNIPAAWRLPKDTLGWLSGVGTADEGRLIRLQAARQSGLLSDRELDITEKHTARDLLPKLAARQLTSVEVTVAFCKRAALAQQLVGTGSFISLCTSCLTEIFFDEAIERAKEADRYLEENGKVRGPLHGLPISMKDSFVVKGRHATVGYVEYLRQPLPEGESTLVKLLQDAGAILYCKTNVPQTMMTADSENNIFGRTLNPHNTQLNAGGSTGGEGALLAFRGSPLGVGTDIAGSIRIPAACCGIYGFKPTADRVPFGGQNACPFPRNRLPGIVPAAGPMANTLADLRLFMDVVVSEGRPWTYDGTTIDIPWRKLASPNPNNHKLVVGIAPEDEEFRLHPPVKRTIEDAARKLEAAGHTVVRLPTDPSRSIALGGRLAFAFYGLEGHPSNAEMEAEFGEPLVKSLAVGVHPFARNPPPLAPHWSEAKKVAEWHRLRGEYCDSWRRAWLEHRLDVVLAPGAISTAVPHDAFGVPVYTAAWNVTNYPACIIPYGSSSKALDPSPMKGHAAFDADYNPELQDDAPCAIQVITPTFKDEECLHAAFIIDEVLNGA
ncbi:amidase signature domain-containing protein [Apiospora phragmitis]|uniref:Amidase signature domain-containing protein n=1 Tax=Apiospora phragmitis TaxID=2905665 RepID=A0ABR1VI73_9PEZI